MQSKSDDKMVRWLCGILFMAFALSWLCLFQADLLDELYQSLMHRWGYDGIVGYGESNFHYYAIPVALALLITLLEIPVARLFRFRDGLYACNYLISALLLGAVTGFEDYNCCMIISGPETKVWIAIVISCVVLFIVCKIIQKVPRQSLLNGPRIVSGNLLIMTLLFCIVGILGNTDENLHRALMIHRYTADGQFEKALQVGENEEEANYVVSNARLNAMLRLDAANPGTGIGEHLFNYPIDNRNRDSMLDYLLLASGNVHESLSAVIAMSMINCELEKADSLITPYIYQGQVPKFYMQLLVLTGNKEAAGRLPDEYAAQKEILDSFRESLENLRDQPEQFQANSTYIKFHKTYFWYYKFSK